MKKVDLETIVSLAKRRGFIFPGSNIYGGISGMWDYGPTGVLLKNNIKQSWWKHFVERQSDIYGVDAAIIMHPSAWEASGHISGFSDPMVECKKCHRRFREDHLTDSTTCPECGGELGSTKQFNLMFETSVGPSQDSSATTYLRPETAGGIFTNFKNILDTFHPNLPFGIAQIGKAFRNEIAPRDFIFRAREFEQMEIEWFCRENEWEKWFEHWRKEIADWIQYIGFSKTHLHENEVEKDDLAHYSKRTIDVEYEYPFGTDELYGLAYRTDFDLQVHAKKSGIDLTYFDEGAKERFVPHVIEPSLGLDRLVLALLIEAYTEEKAPTADGKTEKRAVLKFAPHIAPIKIAVLPLMRKDGLSEKAHEIFDLLKEDWVCQYDETASIGKRYRRQDEIGTPYCVTIDYETLENGTVTVRDRDSMQQERIAIDKLQEFFASKSLR